ncbi:unnamed protein product [Phytophthora fragariaefolia]|uniref:Unnamed protein product n=1 Tax=Phytophthora fragariaefolia TaxID=1490495 RepID=A0A9W6XB52_9STRA|nr:unnamed protein product [Phytophthora fragariaefolia]
MLIWGTVYLLSARTFNHPSTTHFHSRISRASSSTYLHYRHLQNLYAATELEKETCIPYETGASTQQIEVILSPSPAPYDDSNVHADSRPYPVNRRKKKRGSKTVKIYKGSRYTKSWKSKKNLAYLCSTSKTTGCKVVLKNIPHGEWALQGDHICRRGVVLNGPISDETEAMKRMTDELATDNPAMSEKHIWEQVCEAFYGPDCEGLLKGLTEGR